MVRELDDRKVENIDVEDREPFHAILGSASMTLTLFAEDRIKEREDDAYHGAKADWIGFRRWMRLRVA
jgi:hypothetical protein